jgi:membrane protein required for colicin V production
MPSYFDLGLIVVVLISALLAMLRGFTREVLAIASWGAAAIAAIYLYPMLVPYIRPYVSKEQIQVAIAAALVFFVTLIIVSLITIRLSDAILDSKVGALDRSLGFVFGAVRGLLLCVVAFIFFNWLVPDQKQPEWVRNARMRPLLQTSGDQLMALLPDDPDGILNRLKAARNGAASDDAADPAKPAPAAPTPPPVATPVPAPRAGTRS